MRLKLASLLVVLTVCFIYGAHFNNSFHFDDDHAVVRNPYIRDISNLSRFFQNAELSSVLPANRFYRPFVTASLAVDHWLAGGLKTPWFHADLLVFYLLQLVAMFVLFRHCVRSQWVAFLGTAIYALHPVMAESVNYVIQRAEVYSTLGVVAALATWAVFPDLRRYHLYLIPAAFGILSKPPAMIFPVLLFLLIWLVEEERASKAVARCLPALAMTAALGTLISRMTPATFNPGAASAFAYRLTQPAVLLAYFRRFFLPYDLSADTDRIPSTDILQGDTALGFVFLVALLVAIWWTGKRRAWMPVTFGLAWFLLAALPTSLTPLAEVENDHRMYFPFVGLAIAVAWTAMRLPRKVLVPAAAVVLSASAWGAWQRCEVWRTEETLWRDVTIKNPRNGRGLMNYGLTLMARGDHRNALSHFERAREFSPDYYYLEINLGVVNEALKNDTAAEQHFRRAIALASGESGPRFFYGRFLSNRGRLPEAVDALRDAVRLNPSALDSWDLLLSTYAAQRDGDSLRQAANEVLAQFPGNENATVWLRRADALRETPESYLNKSLFLYRAGKFEESIAAAAKALALRPNYAAALNNMMAGYNSLGRWQDAIRFGEQAVKLDPSNTLARNNLAWAKSKIK